MSQAIMSRGLEKSFARKRSLGQLFRDPFGRGEEVHALRGVDLAVNDGEIVGLLGPNGAGKTTLLKILSGLILPDKGSAEIGGISTEKENRIKRLLGLVHPDERSFYWRLTGRENLRFFATLYDVPHRKIEQRIDQLLEDLDLVAPSDRRFADYSSGMKQRMSIARAMLHDPPILLMDEPSRSLDPASSLALRELVDERLRVRHGKTILIASHDLAEVQALCDRIYVLIDGRVRLEGTVDDVRRFGVDDVEVLVELEDGPATISGPFKILDDGWTEGRRSLRLSLEAADGFSRMLRSLIDDGCKVRRCDQVEPDLESAFTRILESHREPS